MVDRAETLVIPSEPAPSGARQETAGVGPNVVPFDLAGNGRVHEFDILDMIRIEAHARPGFARGYLVPAQQIGVKVL